MTPLRRLILAAAMAALCAAAPPKRIVSLNPCLDADLVALADADQIAALSHYSSQPEESNLPAEIAARFAMTHETAEEILLLKPDLVLATRHNALSTRQILERLGVAQALFDVPDSIEANYAQLRKVAALIGHPDRGDSLIGEIEAALAAAAPLADAKPVTALIFHMPSGFSIGQGTVTDEMMRRAGLENAAGRYFSGKAGTVPLEALIADPPRLILSDPERRDWGWGARLLNHPALAHLEDRIARVAYPRRLLNCGGPVLIENAAALAAARKRVE